MIFSLVNRGIEPAYSYLLVTILEPMAEVLETLGLIHDSKARASATKHIENHHLERQKPHSVVSSILKQRKFVSKDICYRSKPAEVRGLPHPTNAPSLYDH